MNFLDVLSSYKEDDTVAISNDFSITYRELHQGSERLANYLKTLPGLTTAPIPVIGHKNPLMVLCFLAIVKSGRAYCPIDTSLPMERIKAICSATSSGLIFNVTDSNTLTPPLATTVLNLNDIQKIIENPIYDTGTTSADWVKPEDTFYIIFTSGSSGTPKGVEISYSALNNYLNWISTVGSTPEDKKNKRFLNQAPFSFDLSVMDLYLSLYSGGTLHLLSKGIQSNINALQKALQEINPQIWVSTPSFADLCLADRSYNEENIPALETFLFCGETLTPKTAKRLIERFPNAKIYNTYGPTESTVCITSILIDKELIDKYNPLPVGYIKPGTVVEIRENGKCLPDGSEGEVVILGDTVAKGYFKDLKKTADKFFIDEGSQLPGYYTGDAGYIENGLLFFKGRLDLQVKLHGYRIELDDIESNLLKYPDVSQACVVPKYDRDGKVKMLLGYCTYTGKSSNPEKDILNYLSKLVPPYMMIRRLKLVDKLPLTNNGKLDRKAVAAMVENKE